MEFRSQGDLEYLHERPRGIYNRTLGRITDLVRPVRLRIPSINTSIRWLGGLLGLIRTRLHSPFTHEEVGTLKESDGNGSDENNVKVHPDPSALSEELVPEQIAEREGLECIAPLGFVSTSVIELLRPVDYHIGVDHRDIRSDGDGHLLSHGRDTVVSEEIDSSAETSPGLETQFLKQRKRRT